MDLQNYLWKTKPSFIKIALLNTVSRNWAGKKSYTKKNMKLNKVGLKELAKLRAFRAFVPYVPLGLTSLCALRALIFTRLNCAPCVPLIITSKETVFEN